MNSLARNDTSLSTDPGSLDLSRQSEGEQASHVHPAGFSFNELISGMSFSPCAEYIIIKCFQWPFSVVLCYWCHSCSQVLQSDNASFLILVLGK